MVFAGLPRSWMQAQHTLQKKILKQTRALGIIGVLPAFQGNMPPREYLQTGCRRRRRRRRRVSSCCGARSHSAIHSINRWIGWDFSLSLRSLCDETSAA